MANAFEIVMDSRKELVERLIQNMEKGYLWTKSAWSSAALKPYNPASDLHYQGGNRLRLMFAAMENGYNDPRWCTYNQAQEKGWNVRRGAKSVLLEKWIFTETKIVENEQGESVKQTVELERPKVNYFRVFNGSQIHGMPKLEVAPEPVYDDIIEAAARSSQCPIVERAVSSAHYIPRKDIIEMPSRFAFKSAEAYLSVQIHEMAHSTGHPDRLNRNILNKSGTPDYAREELRAELSSAFFKSNLNIPLSTEQLQDHSNYLTSWIEVLKQDPNELFRACKDAEKISDFLAKNYEQVLEIQKKETTTEKTVEDPSGSRQMPSEFFTINIDSNSIPTIYESADDALNDYFNKQTAPYVFDARTVGFTTDRQESFVLIHRDSGIDIVNPDRIDLAQIHPDLEKTAKGLSVYLSQESTYIERISVQLQSNGLHMTDSLRKNFEELHSVTGEDYYLRDFAGSAYENIDFGSGRAFAEAIHDECRQQQWEQVQTLSMEELAVVP